MSDKIYLGKHNYTVYSYHTDSKEQVNATSLLSFLQESAWEHAAVNNFGYELLQDMNCIWAMFRLNVKIHKYAKWHDVVTLETWSKAPDPLMAHRDFELFNANNEKLLSATSAWLIVNADTRRPQRVAILGDKFPILQDREAIPSSSKRLAFSGEETKVNSLVIPYSAMDVNGHVNNVNYVQWVLDSMPCNYLKENEISEIEINFLHESHAGDTCEIYVDEISENKFQCKLVRTDDNKDLVKMILDFRKHKE